MKKNNKSKEWKSIALVVVIALVISVAVFAVGNGMTGNAINVRRGTTPSGGNYVGWGQGQKIVGDSNGFQFLSTGAEGQKEIARLDKDGNLNINGQINTCNYEEILKISEGRVTTVSLCGKSYSIASSYIGENNVRLAINGEDTSTLDEGQSALLSDGVIIKIIEIGYSSREDIFSSVRISFKKGNSSSTGDSLKLYRFSVDKINDYYDESIVTIRDHRTNNLYKAEVGDTIDIEDLELYISKIDESGYNSTVRIKVNSGAVIIPTLSDNLLTDSPNDSMVSYIGDEFIVLMYN